jgi:hypothetical protein
VVVGSHILPAAWPLASCDADVSAEEGDLKREKLDDLWHIDLEKVEAVNKVDGDDFPIVGPFPWALPDRVLGMNPTECSTEPLG